MIKVTCHKGIVEIDSDSISYARISDMYTNYDGVGMQKLEGSNVVAVKNICNEIAAKLYELEELLNEVE